MLSLKLPTLLSPLDSEVASVNPQIISSHDVVIDIWTDPVFFQP